MRRSREEAAETRRNILATASRLFRARGIAPVSVADVTATSPARKPSSPRQSRRPRSRRSRATAPPSAAPPAADARPLSWMRIYRTHTAIIPSTAVRLPRSARRSPTRDLPPRRRLPGPLVAFSRSSAMERAANREKPAIGACESPHRSSGRWCWRGPLPMQRSPTTYSTPCDAAPSAMLAEVTPRREERKPSLPAEPNDEPKQRQERDRDREHPRYARKKVRVDHQREPDDHLRHPVLLLSI